MNLILLIILAMVFAGALFALSMGIEGRGRGRVDRDADGEQDEPGGPPSGAP
ncbi:hypothetical protein MU852_08390 [Brevundimonas albigilva]|uniref:hypothetical protein n=1 Tax=Brevundimonas albigilva TaxID=1312364 RepID=UPI00201B897B|nr:hypothetical protein [Brevundimonas albigilva]UQV19720.1 hypothetical protein MU852_08390 [Brevundimonas albigilva]